ncbi:MAG: aminotransferase class I/II-fold pyridoxal phosphate-dependent enzyme, partial [Bacteroidales bacterium]
MLPAPCFFTTFVTIKKYNGWIAEIFAETPTRWSTGLLDYLDNIEEYPVKSQVKPGDIQLTTFIAAAKRRAFSALMEDFNSIIMPGITHWQSPNFFAYFPANSSPPSILAEMLTSALAAQCMIWETSPSAAELEERVMNWLRDMIGLPSSFEGVIQDTASTAGLAALITAREKVTGLAVNRHGFSGDEKLRVYGSTQTHSSIDKAVQISGIGRDNLVKVGVNPDFSMNVAELEEAIKTDIAAGFKPCMVVATLGTTSTTAIDPLEAIGEICDRYGVWLHVDAALGGTALILPEFAWMIRGKEYIDSFVFNPHKWMFT